MKSRFDFNSILEHNRLDDLTEEYDIEYFDPDFPNTPISVLSHLANYIHLKHKDWWVNENNINIDRNMGELLCLVHSEISEALEGYRKDLMDDHLPHRKAFEVELADAVIRILDIVGAMGLDIDGAIDEKLEYNQQRADHKRINRMKDGGKKF